ncbi:hypothetical protein [Agrobacterium tumefaciens]|uniref:hypothetical protein n=1 Tax=Agrobacterium tumefaciens TaxID=358 RepID=UPI00287D0142|nr:hypothetical protein [Agrobacterium tumefaciens]MDS7594395.1 hypothetical protein [Agrobacterium tumefaciens]
MITMMDSHAYPGCLVSTDRDIAAGPTHVQFSDGIVAEASIDSIRNDQIIMTINSYTTSKGTAIAQKSWILVSLGPDRWRIKQRYDPKK